MTRPLFYSGYGTLLSATASALRDAKSKRGKSGVLTEQDRMRRFTPRERERLQGFPDDWTMIPWRGRPARECPDGHRIAATGNAMTTYVITWIGRRIAADVAAATSRFGDGSPLGSEAAA